MFVLTLLRFVQVTDIKEIVDVKAFGELKIKILIFYFITIRFQFRRNKASFICILFHSSSSFEELPNHTEG